jgi:ribonuclease-3
MGLDEFIDIDPSIAKNKSAVRSISGNALEALIGAIYVDKGYHFTKRYVKKKIVKPFLDFDELKDITVNFKSLLNQYAQKNKKHLEFKILNDEGEKRIRTFIIAVMIDGVELARGRGKSKKVAEQIASEKSCDLLKLSKSYKS